MSLFTACVSTIVTSRFAVQPPKRCSLVLDVFFICSSRLPVAFSHTGSSFTLAEDVLRGDRLLLELPLASSVVSTLAVLSYVVSVFTFSGSPRGETVQWRPEKLLRAAVAIVARVSVLASISCGGRG